MSAGTLSDDVPNGVQQTPSPKHQTPTQSLDDDDDYEECDDNLYAPDPVQGASNGDVEMGNITNKVINISIWIKKCS